MHQLVLVAKLSGEFIFPNSKVSSKGFNHEKTLIALAAMSAFAAAGTAAAADVTLYGKADLGLHYTYNKVDGQDAVNSFDMKSGQNAGSRFGLKGTEDLGNGTKVGFILENGFNADDGTMGQDSRLFGREANLFVTGDFGTLSMGRVGALSSGMGSYNVVYGYAAFGTGWGDYAGAKSQFNLADRDRMDNTVTYVTPNFAGVKVYAQYSSPLRVRNRRQRASEPALCRPRRQV